MAHQPVLPTRALLIVVYRWTSVLWLMYAASLGAFASGSALLERTPVRYVVTTLAVLAALAMLLRLFVPWHPEWTRWSLPLIGALSLSTAVHAAFGVEGLGFTLARVAVVGLTLVPGLMAYVHWIGLSAVESR